MSILPSTTDVDSRNWRQLLTILPSEVRDAIEALSSADRRLIEEIRLRVDQPIEVRSGGGAIPLQRKDTPDALSARPLVLSSLQLDHILEQVTQFSMYAVEEELRRGFITMPGGHRVGVAGRVIVAEGGSVKSIRNVSSLNIRVAHAIPGIATPLRRTLANQANGQPYSTLVISPPQCGKTTLVRDIAKQWSENQIVRQGRSANVVVIDERSEIAGCIDGVPQFDLGPRVDVLDACPKAEGMLMAIRSLSPDVIVTDEIGRADDAFAVLEALHSGVSVITTAHARSVDEWRRRPHMRDLFESGAFSRYIVLSRRRGPGTVEGVYDALLRPVAH